ncbi:NTP transferase domain-containing protein [Flagellimonas sp. S174]|uniref:NTP transferase domain-containing protein n=1 Tax=Flagellimonas sp. S174 TaxID=3410790 RepID=UPI003BF4DEFE
MSNTPKLYGLVLGGGRSIRMGSEKRLLKYHGSEQQARMYNLLEQVCEASYLSIRQDQVSLNEDKFKIIIDENRYKGPFNGILSAHAAYPKVAWLVLACDLPFMDKESLKTLIAKRNSLKSATAMATKKTDIPEPLVTIWEPKGLEKAKEFLEVSKNSGPTEFLRNSEIDKVYPSTDDVLFNANSQADFEQVKSHLNALQDG